MCTVYTDAMDVTVSSTIEKVLVLSENARSHD